MAALVEEPSGRCGGIEPRFVPLEDRTGPADRVDVDNSIIDADAPLHAMRVVGADLSRQIVDLGGEARHARAVGNGPTVDSDDLDSP